MAIRRDTRRLQRHLEVELRRLTDQLERDLIAAWATSWDEIATDLNAVLVDLLTGDDIAVNRLLLASRLRRALNVVADRLDQLTASAGVRIRQDLREVIETAGAAQASIVDSQLPPNSGLVDLQSWTRVDHRQIEAIVARSTQQITSRLRPLSGDAYDAMRRELLRGVPAGSNPRTVARRILQRTRGPFAGGLTRATTIARTEILDAHRAGSGIGQAQHADVLKGWMWLASMSPRTCQACLSMHGTIHALDEPGPEGHQNCRCSRMPVVRPWNELGLDGDELPSLVTDADDYFASLNPTQQVGILGERGYQAWSAGRWPRSKWAERRTTTGWRDSIVPAKPPRLPGRTVSTRPMKPARPPRGAENDPAQMMADRILGAAVKSEPATTMLVQQVAESVGGALARLEFRIKTRASIIDKLTRPGVDMLIEANNIKDALRYTIVLPKRTYWRGAQNVYAAFTDSGYKLIKAPAGWGRRGYRGMNLALLAPDGTVFEVQLHTAASMKAAERAHLIYEEQRRLPVGSERWRELQAEMDKIFDSVPWPPGLPRIG